MTNGGGWWWWCIWERKRPCCCRSISSAGRFSTPNRLASGSIAIGVGRSTSGRGSMRPRPCLSRESSSQRDRSSRRASSTADGRRRRGSGENRSEEAAECRVNGLLLRLRLPLLELAAADDPENRCLRTRPRRVVKLGEGDRLVGALDVEVIGLAESGSPWLTRELYVNAVRRERRRWPTAGEGDEASTCFSSLCWCIVVSSEEVDGEEVESRASKRLINSCTAVLTESSCSKGVRDSRMEYQQSHSSTCRGEGDRTLFLFSLQDIWNKKKRKKISSFCCVLFPDFNNLKILPNQWPGPVLPTKSRVTVRVAWDRWTNIGSWEMRVQGACIQHGQSSNPCWAFKMRWRCSSPRRGFWFINKAERTSGRI